MRRLAEHSQYFLRSPRLVRELIGHTSIKKSDTVIDIGAGAGIITSALASRCSHVISYEFDPRMIKKLYENVGRFDNVTIHEEDFLTANLPTVNYKIFANIPFHVSSPIFHKITEADNPPRAIYLIVQKQFANKLLIDKPGFTGMLGAQVAPLFTARVRKPLQKHDYWPHPAVDTVLIELKLRDEALIDKKRLPNYRNFVADCFADPKIFTVMPLAKVGIVGKKPSELSTAEWVSLFALQQRY
jgi:23S rRNA (adenine-N6)-dimethyltransferase